MNIDKFGHHVHKRLRLSEIVASSENCLVKTEIGDYNLQSSRLIGAKTPLTPDEVANKEYVDNKLIDYVTKKEIPNFMEAIKTDIIENFRQFEQKFCTKDYIGKLIKQQNVQAASGK